MNLKIIAICIFCIIPIKSYCQDVSDLNIFDKNKVFSIISVNYFYKKQPILKNSKIECELNFYDDYKEKVISKIDENSNYIILLSNPGKIFLESIKCSRHSIPLIYGASRFKFIDDLGFVAHKGFVNYVGELNLYYYPSFFKILDIFNLSGFSNDTKGIIQTDVRDAIFDALNFINSRFTNIYHLKLTKSLLMDSHSLKPNDIPEEYSQKNMQKDASGNVDQSFLNQVPIQENIPEIITEKDVKKNDEIVPEKNIEENEIITKKELIEELEDTELKTSRGAFQNPQYPYLAPRYSDFYSPVYNPYNRIGNPSSYYLMHTYGVQDPVTEHPH
jgi:hypothetical protein